MRFRLLTVFVLSAIAVAGCSSDSKDSNDSSSRERSRSSSPSTSSYERCRNAGASALDCSAESGSPSEQFVDLDECLGSNDVSESDCEELFGFDPDDAAQYGDFITCVWEGGYEWDDCGTLFPTPDLVYRSYEECDAATGVGEICYEFFQEDFEGGEGEGEGGP